jgi:hypothetical protein
MVTRSTGVLSGAYARVEYFCEFGSVSEIIARSTREAGEVIDAKLQSQLLAMARYCRDFLTRPSPQVGRSGPVCPFTSRAIARGTLLITACTLNDADGRPLTEALGVLREAFLTHDASLSEENQLFHSVVVVFPGLPADEAPALIEEAQRSLKPDYVDAGLMIGEFYPGCPAPGLHNADFRPLQSPVPAIAIRHMTPQDAPFMLGDPRFRESYERRFGEEGSRRVQDLLDRRAGCPVARIAGPPSAPPMA